MACVAAVLAVALLFRLLANHIPGRNGILLALFVAQGAQLALGTDYRWNRAPWDGRWFNVEIPERLASDPNLYLELGGPIPSLFLSSQRDRASLISLATTRSALKARTHRASRQ